MTDEITAGTATRIKAAAIVVGLEALGLLGFAIAEALSISSDRPTIGITNALFFTAYSVGLAFVARGLAQLRSWSRGPVVLAQLIQLGVAWSFYGDDTVWVAVLLAIPAVFVLFVVFSPTTTTALYGSTAHAHSDEDR